MSLTVTLPAAVRFVGDSITAFGWDNATGGMRSQMGAAAYAVATGGSRIGAVLGSGSQGTTTVTGAKARIQTTPDYPLTFASYGIPGAGIHELTASYNTVVGTDPIDLMVLECGVNDWGVGGTDPTRIATHLTEYRAFLDAVRAQFGCQVLCIGALAGILTGEQWTTGPTRYSSGLSSSSFETNMATACSERPTWTEYVRQLDWALAENVARTVPGPGNLVGALTFDGVHPTVYGQQRMATNAMTHLTFV